MKRRILIFVHTVKKCCKVCFCNVFGEAKKMSLTDTEASNMLIVCNVNHDLESMF